MSRNPRLITTLALLMLVAGTLVIGARWSLASPIELPAPMPRPQPHPHPHLHTPRLDVAFVVDTTGSMADEIAVVKAKILEMAAALRAGQPQPDVRFALVCYRDRGDTYVTQVFPFTRDIQTLHGLVGSVRADGGGDSPESVNEALHVAVDALEWDADPRVSRQIFLIGDAGPHMDYGQDFDYRQVARAASERRITIDAISCSGMDPFGISVFQHVTKATNGRFEYLTYAREMQQVDGSVTRYLESGGRTFAADKSVDEEAWREAGAGGLVSESRASEVAPADVKGRQVGGVKNNLDSVMINRLKARAVKDQGVVYAD